MNTLTIIVPCFNEEEVFKDSSKKLVAVLDCLVNAKSISKDSKLLFVDDGSKDSTWRLIVEATKKNNHIKGIKFTRNYGHQNALLAGMTEALKYSDLIVTIDADLQDDINAIVEMVDKYKEGYEVVYGVRNNRDTDTPFKRKTAESYYTLMRKIGVDLVPNSADFRLLSRRATETLLKFKEQNLFFRGLVPQIGYKSTKVFYKRRERKAGESKYTLKKMIAFAVDGITSFSTMPIKIVMALGIFVVGISFLLLSYTLYQKLIGNVVTGWSSLMISIWFIGGIQLICFSLIGEYIGKIFIEVKARPRYNIETRTDDDNNNEGRINEIN